jgi:chromosome segregation ATPase
MTASITSAAAALAHARAAAEQTSGALAAVKAARTEVDDRIAACEAARRELRQRRGLAATIDDGIGARLALLDADLETLREVVAERARAVAEARAADAAARQAVSHAEHVLTTERDAELTRRLVDHAENVGTVLLATLTELAALDKAAGRRQSWAPSRDLAQALQSLYLNANGVRR